MALVEHVVVPIARAYEPGLIAISAGYDAHRDDPLASCAVETEALADMSATIRALAAELGARPRVPRGRVLTPALADSVVATAAALEDGRPPGSAPVAAAEPHPVACGSAGTFERMGAEDNKRLIRRALDEIYTRGDLELVDEPVHPDFIDYEPAHPEQPRGPGEREAGFAPPPDTGGLRFESRTRSPGGQVVQRVTMSGRQTGPLTGREATGREFAVRHIYIWRIADDKIVEHWGSRDDLGLLGQLGLLPKPRVDGSGGRPG